MSDFREFREELFDNLSCLTPDELIKQAEYSNIALVGEIALQVCGEQVLSALELNDFEGAGAYLAARPTLTKYALRAPPKS